MNYWIQNPDPMETGKFSWIKIILIMLGLTCYCAIAIFSPFKYFMWGILILFVLFIMIVFDVDTLLSRLMEPERRVVLELQDPEDFYDDFYDIINSKSNTEEKVQKIISLLVEFQGLIYEEEDT